MWIKKNNKLFSTICFYAFVAYMLETICSYAEFFPRSTKIFVYSSTTGLILRMAASFFLIASSFFVFASNYNRIKKKWFLIVAIMVFFEFLSLLFTPSTYDVLFKTGQTYPFMAHRHISVSVFDSVVFSLSQSVDLVFGLLFMSILPLVLNKRRMIIVLNIFIFVVFYSIVLSFFREKSYYIYFLKGNWKYSNDSIGSIFGNKQQWGIFLVSGFCASIYIMHFLLKEKPFKRAILIFLIMFYSLFLFGCIFCSTVAFCKTAIVCYLIFIILFIIFIIFRLIKNRKTRVLGVAVALLFVVCFTLIILVNHVEALRTNLIGRLIYNIFRTLEDKSEQSISVRLSVVYCLLEKFPSINLMFGFPKGILDAYVRTISPELLIGLHTGIASYFGRTGVFGFVIYGILIFKLIKLYINAAQFSKSLTFLYFGIFAVSIVMNLSESEILIFSSSINGLILNLLLVTDPYSNASKFKRRIEDEEKRLVLYC